MALHIDENVLIVVIAALCSGCSRKGDSGIAIPGGHNSNGNGASSPRAAMDS